MFVYALVFQLLIKALSAVNHYGSLPIDDDGGPFDVACSALVVLRAGLFARGRALFLGIRGGRRTARFTR